VILVDTSVWVDHLHAHDQQLELFIEAGEVATHPMVIGELATGNLTNRQAFLTQMAELPQVRTADHLEVLEMIDNRHLYGIGLSYVDIHLLAASFITPGCRLLTRDRRLKAQAENLAVAWPPTA
jgi:predicted nucleic acid-binding protein